VLAAGRDAGIDFVLNARTDVFVLREKGADRKELMREAVRRGQAFLEAGAPVVFVPGVMTRDEIEVLVGELGPRRTSLIAVPGVTPPTHELEQIGVARVSAGPFTLYTALNALRDAATAFVGGGSLPADALPQT
jgi:2-methylisocitrate lyase-like PEP mutase family enzyme